jgi:hypothetical protein
LGRKKGEQANKNAEKKRTYMFCVGCLWRIELLWQQEIDQGVEIAQRTLNEINANKI